MFSAEYMAGFFDGEGYVGIVGSRPGCHGYGLQVSIGQIDRRPLDWLRNRFGGGVTRNSVSAIGRTCYKWRAVSQEAVAFLEWIRPHVVLKAEQIDIALTFAALPKPQRGIPMAEVDSVQREDLRAAIMAAKRV